MTQPAKAQEPSMEEILASIRRIIADEESVKPQTRAAPEPYSLCCGRGSRGLRSAPAKPDAASPIVKSQPRSRKRRVVSAMFSPFRRVNGRSRAVFFLAIAGGLYRVANGPDRDLRTVLGPASPDRRRRRSARGGRAASPPLYFRIPVWFPRREPQNSSEFGPSPADDRS